MDYLKHRRERLWRHRLSTPFIWLPLVAFFVLDLFVEVYHRTCFPLYGLPLVPRNEYIRIDRQKLSYLTWWQKINCIYCGYANGLMAYCTRIVGETERYWCGIQHQQGKGYRPPEHHKEFLVYGDEEGFRKLLGEG